MGSNDRNEMKWKKQTFVFFFCWSKSENNQKVRGEMVLLKLYLSCPVDKLVYCSSLMWRSGSALCFLTCSSADTTQEQITLCVYRSLHLSALSPASTHFFLFFFIALSQFPVSSLKTQTFLLSKRNCPALEIRMWRDGSDVGDQEALLQLSEKWVLSWDVARISDSSTKFNTI